MWGRDAANVEGSSRSRRTSLHSAYARTVMGSSFSLDTATNPGRNDAHGLRCKRCNLVQFLVRALYSPC